MRWWELRAVSRLGSCSQGHEKAHPGVHILTCRWSRLLTWSGDGGNRRPLLSTTHHVSPSAASHWEVRETLVPTLKAPSDPLPTDRQGKGLSQNVVAAKSHGSTKEAVVHHDWGTGQTQGCVVIRGGHLKRRLKFPQAEGTA